MTVLYSVISDRGTSYFATKNEAIEAARAQVKETGYSATVDRCVTANVPKKALCLALLNGGWAEEMKEVITIYPSKNYARNAAGEP